MWYQKIEVQTLWKKGNSSDHSDSALIDCNMYLYMYTYGIYIYIIYIIYIYTFIFEYISIDHNGI